METANHTKNLVNPSLARFVIQELMRENVILRKRRKELLEIQRTTLEPFAFIDFEAVTKKMNQNLVWLQKMEVIMEMEESYKNGDLPQGYTFNPELSGLNNPANR
jgi:hypothetical protein